MNAVRRTGFAIVLLCPLASWAQDSVTLKGCYASETTIIDRAGGVVFGMNVTRGVTDKVAGPEWFPDKLMHDCRVVFTASKAGVEFQNRCNFVDAAGDRVLSAASGTREGFEWKWVAGTGKFEGIAGSGTAKIDAVYPQAGPTVSGGCWSGKGTFSIRK